MNVAKKKGRGFAGLTADERRKIAQKGGRASQESGNGHRFREGSKETIDAARKGGETVAERNRVQKGPVQ